MQLFKKINILKKNWLTFALGFVAVFLFRMIPFRPPNIEPLLALQMPFSKAYGASVGFLFGFFSIVVFDLATGHLGISTLVTGAAYGVLGLWATRFFRKGDPGPMDYARFAVIGTLFFDAVTGLSIGPLIFHQSFMSALVGQIPFTIWHLIGNVSFALILSPAIYRLAIKKES